VALFEGWVGKRAERILRRNLRKWDVFLKKRETLIARLVRQTSEHVRTLRRLYTKGDRAGVLGIKASLSRDAVHDAVTALCCAVIDGTVGSSSRDLKRLLENEDAWRAARIGTDFYEMMADFLLLPPGTAQTKEKFDRFRKALEGKPKSRLAEQRRAAIAEIEEQSWEVPDIVASMRSLPPEMATRARNAVAEALLAKFDSKGVSLPTDTTSVRADAWRVLVAWAGLPPTDGAPKVSKYKLANRMLAQLGLGLPSVTTLENYCRSKSGPGGAWLRDLEFRRRQHKRLGPRVRREMAEMYVRFALGSGQSDLLVHPRDFH
jgi:hypothetical protein